MRRTVTNKFSGTIEPYARAEVRDRAFEDKDFCAAVDKAVEALARIAKDVQVEKDEIKKAIAATNKANRDKRKAKRDAKK